MKSEMKAGKFILAATFGCLMAAGMPVRAAASGAGTDDDLIESCDAAGETTALRRYICSQPDLRAEIAEIAQRYSQITRNADVNVRILARWDFRFFRIALSSCAPLSNMDVCAHSRITQKGQLLSLPVSAPRLAAAIKQNGILDPDLIARYPAAFVNVEAAFPGQAELAGRQAKPAGGLSGRSARHPRSPSPGETGGAPSHQAEPGGGLNGRFISRSGKSYPMEAPQGLPADHSASGWFRGHMELRGKTLVMVLSPAE